MHKFKGAQLALFYIVTLLSLRTCFVVFVAFFYAKKDAIAYSPASSSLLCRLYSLLAAGEKTFQHRLYSLRTSLKRDADKASRG